MVLKQGGRWAALLYCLMVLLAIIQQVKLFE